LGRRRRRVIRIVKKKLPTVFVCPRCGEEAVRVTIAKDTGHATVLCALCNLKDDFPAHPAAQAIDVYSYFTDRFYGVKDPHPIIPHEREISSVPAEETTVEEEEELAPPEPLKSEATAETPQQSPSTNEPIPEAQPTVTEQAQPVTQALSEKQEIPAETVEPLPGEEEKEKEDDSEPFADIMENSKDKKRYSSNPLPQRPPEQTS
jgi:transcription elongation factor Elf1